MEKNFLDLCILRNLTDNIVTIQGFQTTSLSPQTGLVFYLVFLYIGNVKSAPPAA